MSIKRLIFTKIYKQKSQEKPTKQQNQHVKKINPNNLDNQILHGEWNQASAKKKVPCIQTNKQQRMHL